ncbi:nicotinamide mononucleotide transporter [Paenibacillus sp. S3N08]|uniref:Nicotinamide mononucleotide transporter n=2 Tax=Paenibacillus agricola TaxID=2716264 RepID=A0ABX0J5T8_9BACL|nr:nicotinamide mononucleotide transporter [Paenibacillus agricola]
MDRWYTVAGLMIAMLIVAYYTSSSTLELVATTTGLLCVWLTARENIWCWPIGLINTTCFFFMFFESKLYADMTLQIVFFLLNVQGWMIWLTKKAGSKVRPTRRMTPWMWMAAPVFIVVLTIGWGYVLTGFTDASIPYADAFIATLSIVAQILLSNKILENWTFWIIVDVLSVGMYAYKELYAVAFLYLIFLGIAVGGLYSWKKEYLEVGKRQGGIFHAR